MSLVENSCRPGKPASGLWDSSAREDILSESGLRSCTVACRVRRIRRCMLTDGEPVGISRDEEIKSFFRSAGTIFSGLMTVRCDMQKKESGRLLPGQTGVVFCGTTAGFLEEKSSSEEDRPEYVSLGEDAGRGIQEREQFFYGVHLAGCLASDAAKTVCLYAPEHCPGELVALLKKILVREYVREKGLFRTT